MQVARPAKTARVIINIRKHTQLVKTLEELEADGAFDNVRDSLDLLDEQGLTPIDQHLLELKQQRKLHVSFCMKQFKPATTSLWLGPPTQAKPRLHVH